MIVTPDAAMLADPATVYPVFIDPPLNGLRERWAWSNNGNFDTDVANRARVGRNPYDGTLYRSYFNFDVSVLHQTKILRAAVKMKLDHSWDCTDNWVWLYRTGAITVGSGGRMSWSTRPLPDHTLAAWAGHANEAGGCGVIQDNSDAVFEGSDVLEDIQYAATSQWNNYVVGLCACNAGGDYESTQDRWKKFFTGSTFLVVTYDKQPNKPTAKAFSLTTDCYKACSSPATVRNTRPTLAVNVSDPYDGNLRTSFEIRPQPYEWSVPVINSTSPVTTAAPGSASWTVATALSDGATYYWRAQSVDENNLTGDWSDWQTLKIDKTPPATPTVSSTQYPYKQWGATVGQPGTFAFTGASGAYDYTWMVDATVYPTTTTASASYTPATDMVHNLRVYASDVAGNKTPNVDHQFWVSPVPNRCWNWRLDETSGTTAADRGNTDTADAVCAPLGSGVTAQPGTLAGGVSFGAGYVGNAASFTDTGQIATVNPVLNTAKSFTVMAWVKPTNLAAAGEQTVVSQDGSVTSRFTLMYRSQANSGTGGWCFALRDADTTGTGPAVACATGAVGGSVPPANNVWVHLGGVYDAVTGKVQIHVMGNQASCNGEMVTATTAGTPWSAPGPFVIGRGKADGASTGYWRGSIDQVYAHQRVLSAAEICQQAVQ